MWILGVRAKGRQVLRCLKVICEDPRGPFVKAGTERVLIGCVKTLMSPVLGSFSLTVLVWVTGTETHGQLMMGWVTVATNEPIVYRP